MKFNGFNAFLSGSLVLAGLSACSGSEPIVEEIKTFEGDKAVLNINIYAASEMTKADGTSADYSKGSDDENYVNKLNFYFYDRTGEYVTCYEGATYTPTENSSALVEEIGTSRVVLTDLLGQNYPSYMVAILNFTPTSSTTEAAFKKNLSEVQNVVRRATPWTVSGSKITNFVMTSSTHSNNGEDFGFIATPVSEENFALQKGNAVPGDEWDASTLSPAVPVNLYVERLASKVQVLFPGEDFNLTEDGYYQATLPQAYEVDGEDRILKVRLYGWGINGQAKEMKYFKAVNDMPNAFRTSDGWDYNGTNRCYWAKTPGYSSNNYPSSFADVEPGKRSGVEGSGYDDDAAIQEPLRYISWDEVKANSFKNGDNIAYVMPHTEQGERVNLVNNQIHHSAISEILIAGQIVDNSGNSLTLFQLGESYYTREGVINYLLHASQAHIWKKTSANRFINIEPSDVDVDYGYDGTFRIIVTNTTDTFYQDSEGSREWDDASAVAAEINAYLPDHMSYCYNDGMLYYNIPIRHLRPYTPGEEIKTGMFGVVRNHWYQVTIGAVKSLGHPVYRGSEHIIPPSDDTRYMIGSSIRIMSWRLVKSTAEL